VARAAFLRRHRYRRGERSRGGLPSSRGVPRRWQTPGSPSTCLVGSSQQSRNRGSTGTTKRARDGRHARPRQLAGRWRANPEEGGAGVARDQATPRLHVLDTPALAPTGPGSQLTLPTHRRIADPRNCPRLSRFHERKRRGPRLVRWRRKAQAAPATTNIPNRVRRRSSSRTAPHGAAVASSCSKRPPGLRGGSKC